VIYENHLVSFIYICWWTWQ